MKEITFDELKALPRDTYELIDIRDDGLIAYGMIPGALHIPYEDILDGKLINGTKATAVAKDDKIVIEAK